MRGKDHHAVHTEGNSVILTFLQKLQFSSTPMKTKTVSAFGKILVKHILFFDYSISVNSFHFMTMILGIVILFSS